MEKRKKDFVLAVFIVVLCCLSVTRAGDALKVCHMEIVSAHWPTEEVGLVIVCGNAMSLCAENVDTFACGRASYAWPWVYVGRSL